MKLSYTVVNLGNSLYLNGQNDGLATPMLQIQGCACLPECLPKFSEHHILWSLRLVVFHAFTLKWSIILSVVP